MMKKAVFSFLKVLLFFIGWAVLAGLIDIPSENPAIWRFWAETIPLLVLLTFTLLFVHIEREKLTIPLRTTVIRGLLIGSLVGLLWIGLPVMVSLAMGQFTLSKNPAIPDFWMWLLATFLNVIMQELLIRGYIYRLLKVRHGLTAALAITALLFTLLHGGAFEAGIIAVINVLTMCLFTHFMFEVEGSLLAPIMAHAVWNIIGGLFLGGIQLADDYPSLFTMIVQQQNLFSGGDYKLEASLFVTILNLVFLVFYYRKYRQQRTNHY